MNRQTHQAHHQAHPDAAGQLAHSGEAITLLRVKPYEDVGIAVLCDGLTSTGGSTRSTRPTATACRPR